MITAANNSHQLLVGLTGGIGMGKTTVANAFSQKGICVVDTDVVAHELTASDGAAIPLIKTQFGKSAIKPDGSMDRDWMRQKVFADTQARLTLEGILHPMIHDESLRQLALATSPYAMVVVPLLLETGIWRRRCDRLLVIDCSAEIQIRRVMKRNDMTREEVQKIIATQASRKDRLAAATEIIDNSGSPGDLVPAVESLHRQYLHLAATKP